MCVHVLTKAIQRHVSVQTPVNWGRLIQLETKHMSPFGNNLIFGQWLGLRVRQVAVMVMVRVSLQMYANV